MGQTHGEKRKTKSGEQVTIVRIAIEEILEKAIDPLVFHVRACTYIRICMCVQITCSCEHTCEVLSRATAIIAGRDGTTFKTTLRIDIRYQ